MAGTPPHSRRGELRSALTQGVAAMGPIKRIKQCPRSARPIKVRQALQHYARDSIGAREGLRAASRGRVGAGVRRGPLRAARTLADLGSGTVGAGPAVRADLLCAECRGALRRHDATGTARGRSRCCGRSRGWSCMAATAGSACTASPTAALARCCSMVWRTRGKPAVEPGAGRAVSRRLRGIPGLQRD